MENSENYSHPEDCGSGVQLIVLVDEVVAGQMPMENFENYLFQFVPGSHIQPIVAVDEVVVERKLMERFGNVYSLFTYPNDCGG